MSDNLHITWLNTTDKDFDLRLTQLLAQETIIDQSVNLVVNEIIHEVKNNGDEALIEYSRRFDNLSVEKCTEFEVPQIRLQAALDSISKAELTALKQAVHRIKSYHEHQCQDSWQYKDADGNLLGQKITPLDKVGIYVPGGKASYPSSVLMNAIPAKVAGVNEIVMMVPTPDGDENELVFAAAALTEVNRVFTLGGAQAIAALTYGTETVPKVDKIVGPGNVYVMAAKRAVFGICGIDMIAGPSEILVLCDGLTPIEWIAMDLCSQAEHDEQAQAILISPDENYLLRVKNYLEILVPKLDRKDIIAKSLQNKGAFIKVEDMTEALTIINRIAPEHLELSVADPEILLPFIRHAGAIFMGPYTTEVLGDYCAGPNHVLPTSGTARFSSPLGVYDFQKRSSLMKFTPEGLTPVGQFASILARSEGLIAHAKSAEYRLRGTE